MHFKYYFLYTWFRNRCILRLCVEVFKMAFHMCVYLCLGVHILLYSRLSVIVTYIWVYYVCVRFWKRRWGGCLNFIMVTWLQFQWGSSDFRMAWGMVSVCSLIQWSAASVYESLISYPEASAVHLWGFFHFTRICNVQFLFFLFFFF